MVESGEKATAITLAWAIVRAGCVELEDEGRSWTLAWGELVSGRLKDKGSLCVCGIRKPFSIGRVDVAPRTDSLAVLI